MSERDPSRREFPPRRESSALCRAATRCCRGGPSLRKGGALVMALLVLAAFPLYLAASAAGVIGDAPTALAKSGNSGPGGGDEDDGQQRPRQRRRR